MKQPRTKLLHGVALAAVLLAASTLTGKTFIGADVRTRLPAANAPDIRIREKHNSFEEPVSKPDQVTTSVMMPWTSSVLCLAAAAGFAVGILQPAAYADGDASMALPSLPVDLPPAATAGFGALASSLLYLGAASTPKRPAGPSLISTSEKNGLLTLLEDTKLLSIAEKTFPKPLKTLEDSGLTKIIEDEKLLSTAESVLLSSNTTNLLFGASALFFGAAYLTFAADISTSGHEITYLLVNILALLGIVTTTAGILISNWFTSSDARDDSKLTLVKCIEGSKVLTTANDYGLLSAAESVAGGRVLATVESSGLIGSAQRNRLLSTAEAPLVALVENKASTPLAVLGIVTLLCGTMASSFGLLLLPAGLAVFVLGIAIGILTPA